MQNSAASVRAKKNYYNVKRGQIWKIGRHRIMCGDSGDTGDVSALMDGSKADLIFTSPPYADLRAYKSKIRCWKTLMQRVCRALPTHPFTQALFNVGIVYQKGEWSWYWVDLIRAMEEQKWKRASWIVWDKISGIPALPTHGKPTPQHEFIFAFRLNKKPLNRILPCLRAGTSTSVNTRQKDGSFRYDKAKRVVVNERKIIGSVISESPQRGNKTGHPAPFPISLPSIFIKSYSNEEDRVFDPFVGSGTTILAAEKTNRVGYGMEIAPEYVDIALCRWADIKPDQKPHRIG